jgi:hypothetical protein
MVATVYFVNWYLHNKENDGWAYKVEGKYTTLDQAKKVYHTQLSNYIDSVTYDQVAVTLTNSYGGTEMVESWTAPEEPNA